MYRHHVALLRSDLYSRTDGQTRYSVLKENCLLIKRPVVSTDTRPSREIRGCNLRINGVPQRRSAAATLGGDKRILWGRVVRRAFSIAVAINGKTARRVREYSVSLQAHMRRKYLCIARV